MVALSSAAGRALAYSPCPAGDPSCRLRSSCQRALRIVSFSFSSFKVMTTFAQAYQDGGASPDIWFQIGYPTDWWRTPAWAPENEPWFYTLKDGWQSGKNGIPAEERAELPALLGQQLASAVGANQQIGVIWVDFTMRQLYPNVF